MVVTPADLSVTVQTKPPLAGTAPPGSTVTVSVDGVILGATLTDGTGNWTFTPTSALPLGSHTVNAIDQVGAGVLAVTSPISNTNTFKVVACVINGDCATATAAFCNTGTNTCVGCSGDAGTGGAFACAAPTPYCAASGACGKCAGNGDCVGHPGGTICNLLSGACGATCVVDTDCTVVQWCSAGLCTPKTPNGQPLPSVAPISGQCSAANGTRVCLSGACDTSNNTCGLTNSKSCGPPPASAVCQSNVCFAADSECGEPNGQPCVDLTVCRSGICFPADSLCGEPNGQPCVSTAVCRSVCVGADDTCGLLNGSPCASATQCRSNVCNPDGKCGDPNGTPCASVVTCRSAVCTGGTCGPACTTDGDCGAGRFCSSGACVPDLPNAQPCVRATQCLSGVCNADGKCGDPDGTGCSSAATCRSGACPGGVCGGGCTLDAQCGAGRFCDATSSTCKPDLPNSTPCGRAAQCASAVCNADGKCGNPDGQPCTTAAVCRGAVCNAQGTCGSTVCTADPQCDAGNFCDLPSGVCKPELPNSMSCARAAQCLSGVCESDGLCGEPNGAACGSPLLCRSNVCTSNGVCGGCQSDGDCGGPTSGRVCGATMTCQDGCRGTGGNGCPAALVCSSTDATIGSCAPPLDLGLPPDLSPPPDLGSPPDGPIADAALPSDGATANDGAITPDAGLRYSFAGGGFCSMTDRAGAAGGDWLVVSLLAAGLWLSVRRRARGRR